MASLHDVAALHDKFGIKRLAKPGFLEDDHMQMRLNFLLEELVETAEACGFELNTFHSMPEGVTLLPTSFIKKEGTQPQFLEQAFDGLIDLVYVALGTADLMGFKTPITITPKGEKRGGMSTWYYGWKRVHEANMSKVRVEKAADSKRGSKFDLRKPDGWKPPQFGDLLS